MCIRDRSTGVAITCPQQTYARIAPRSGLTVKNYLTTMAGVIDPDYTGEVKVILHNFGTTTQVVQPQQKIAQLILERAQTPTITIVESLATTIRGDKGFGSTDKPINMKDNANEYKSSEVPLMDNLEDITNSNDLQTRSTAAAAVLKLDLHTTIQPMSSVQLSCKS